MSDLPDVEYLKPFIEATNSAAARFRRVLIVMITASVLAFGAAWNSKEHGWFNSRIKAARKGEAFLALQDVRNRLEMVERQLHELGRRRAAGEEKQRVDDEERWRSEEKMALLAGARRILGSQFNRYVTVSGGEDLYCELSRGDYDRVREWISARMMPDSHQAGQYALKLEEARTADIILVNIPFFGLVFDVNDLGLLGGFTFMVILLIFRFTLWREYNNLRLTFRAARPEHLEYCYKSLAMEQVLTVPPTLSHERPPQKPWGQIVRALYLPPFVAQAYILYLDYSTIPIGDLFHPGNTRTSIIGSIIFLLVIALLTAQCWMLSVSIDREWKIAAEDVRKAAEDARQAALDKWLI